MSIWPHGDAAWILLLVAGAIVLQLSRQPRPEPPAAPGADPSTAATEVRRASSRRGLRRAALWLGAAVGATLAVVLVAAAIFAAVFHVHVGNGIGDQTYEVTTLGDLHPDYKLGIGDLRVDLSGVQLPVGVTHLKTRVDVGRVVVVVPRDVALRVHSEADLGTVSVLGQSGDGRKVDRSVDQTGRRVLELDAHVGAGSVHVERAVR